MEATTLLDQQKSFVTEKLFDSENSYPTTMALTNEVKLEVSLLIAMLLPNTDNTNAFPLTLHFPSFPNCTCSGWGPLFYLRAPVSLLATLQVSARDGEGSGYLGAR